MEFCTYTYPHPRCTLDSKRGCDAPLGRCKANRGIPRLLCTMYQGTFSMRQSITYCGVSAEEPHDTITMRALAEGNTLQGIEGVVDKDTIVNSVTR